MDPFEILTMKFWFLLFKPGVQISTVNPEVIPDVREPWYFIHS